MADDTPKSTPDHNPELPPQSAEEKAVAEFLERQLEAEMPNMAPEMRRQLARMGAAIQRRDAEREASRGAAPEPKAAVQEPPPPALAEVLRFLLPFGEDTRPISNVMARCALFAPVKERRRFDDYTVVGRVEGCLIEWKGEQLNQDDHDTFMQLVQMARHQPLGTDVVQPVNAILRGLGRHTRQEQRRQLFEQCDRLMSGVFRITPDGKASYAGHLLADIVTPQNQRTEPQHRRFLSYQLNVKLAPFYADDAFTLIDWGERLKIKGRGSELAKWLHLWISSHAEQYPHKVETIRRLCGSQVKDLKHFREKLRQALDLLKDAGVITSWAIDAADLVHIDRMPSTTQLEHIAKKAAKEDRRRKTMTHISDLLPRPPKPKGKKG
ncbi:TrfA protein [Methylomagnum ishizawai]|uniref:TrfA protein n=1 Tax=Methylomagnum ishizawai TaxID=1760988 RepID=A0A1Y6DEA7_9GAMM|nr:plasmid replication initiator TrfA [Methylomagnum ishizawai]SMF97775.1 TrfA protein [Methylomagnum ishizawai]